MDLAEDRPKTPKPPRLGLIVAVMLEISVVATFTVHHSVVGLLLCAAYAWFSATWALFQGSPPER
jgi:hypothetical protein